MLHPPQLALFLPIPHGGSTLISMGRIDYFFLQLHLLYTGIMGLSTPVKETLSSAFKGEASYI